MPYRRTRQSFILAMIAVFLGFSGGIMSFIGLGTFFSTNGLMPSWVAFTTLVGLLVLFTMGLLSFFILTIQRLHDLNASGMYCLIWIVGLVPLSDADWSMLFSIGLIISLTFGLYLIFKPGTKGRNQFGPDPLEDPWSPNYD